MTTIEHEEESYEDLDRRYTAFAACNLRVTRAGDWRLVDDGDDVWLTDEPLRCSPTSSAREARERAREMDESDASEAYTDLCSYTGHCASRVSGVCDEYQIIQAVRARLINVSDAHDYWGAGERLECGCGAEAWRIAGECVDDAGTEMGAEIDVAEGLAWICGDCAAAALTRAGVGS